MARGTRNSTKEQIEVLRESDPLSIGPYLGALATSLSVSAANIAELTGATEQTVFRWIMGRSPVEPRWGKLFGRALALLGWMHDEKMDPLTGPADQRKAQLVAAMKAYNARSSAEAVSPL